MSAASTMYLSNAASIFILSFAPFSDVLIISGVTYPAHRFLTHPTSGVDNLETTKKRFR